MIYYDIFTDNDTPSITEDGIAALYYDTPNQSIIIFLYPSHQERLQDTTSIFNEKGHCAALY